MAKFYCKVVVNPAVNQQPIFIRVNAVSGHHALSKIFNWVYQANGFTRHEAEAVPEQYALRIGLLDNRVYIPVTPSLNQQVFKL